MKRRTTVVDKIWAEQLDADGVEAVLSLGMYNRRASLLFEHTDEWMQKATDASLAKEERQLAFWGDFIPYYAMWVSSVYVVFEAIKQLGIDDKIIKEIAKELDIDLLRKYRNSCFHFDPKFRSDRQTDFISRNGFIAVRKLFERQEKLVIQMIELIKYNSYFDIVSI